MARLDSPSLTPYHPYVSAKLYIRSFSESSYAAASHPVHPLPSTSARPFLLHTPPRSSAVPPPASPRSRSADTAPADPAPSSRASGACWWKTNTRSLEDGKRHGGHGPLYEFAAPVIPVAAAVCYGSRVPPHRAPLRRGPRGRPRHLHLSGRGDPRAPPPRAPPPRGPERLGRGRRCEARGGAA